MAHDTRTCEWPDCSEPITGRKHYCEPHRIEAVRASIRRYRLADPERSRQQVRDWYARDPEHAKKQARERMKRWRAANPEKAHAWRKSYPERSRASERETARKWRDANRDKFRAQQHARREREKGLEGLYVTMTSEWLCLICRLSIDPADDWHWDHEPPLAWREKHPDYIGWHVKRRAHAACNMRKGARWAA